MPHTQHPLLFADIMRHMQSTSEPLRKVSAPSRFDAHKIALRAILLRWVREDRLLSIWERNHILWPLNKDDWWTYFHAGYRCWMTGSLLYWARRAGLGEEVQQLWDAVYPTGKG